MILLCPICQSDNTIGVAGTIQPINVFKIAYHCLNCRTTFYEHEGETVLLLGNPDSDDDDLDDD